MTGRVLAVHVIPVPEAPPVSVTEVLALEGKGLEGDRHSLLTEPPPHRQVTLIEAEALEALRRDYGVELSGADTRRNILTEGVALNHLVGREFTVGEVRLRGIKLCEPCEKLERGAKKAGVLRGLVHRGGLRCEIRSTGLIRVGDAVAPLPTSVPSPTSHR